MIGLYLLLKKREVITLAKKLRADEFLVRHALADDIVHARALIMSGVVYIGEQRCDTSGQMLDEGTYVEVRDKSRKYVSRGGLKLEKALSEFGLDLNGVVAMDIGASTGGFTDCMLINGAKKVYSVDVGYGQLAWKLRSDSRVVNMERTNVRFLSAENLDEMIDFISVDVSFISLALILPVMRDIMSQNGEAVVLVKPQFEAKRDQVGDKGVVTDRDVHTEVIKNCIDYATKNNFDVCALTYSPIKGPEGNIEYLMHLQRGDGSVKINEDEILKAVNESHEAVLTRH